MFAPHQPNSANAVATSSGQLNTTATRRVDTVVFDLGNVLIDWNPRYLYRELFEDEARMEWFLTHVVSHDWNVQMDAGKPFAEAVRERAQLFPEFAHEIGLWHTGWHNMLRDVLPETEALVRALHAQDVPLYALSNWSAETFPVARQRFDVLRLFRHIVISGEEGCAKPDALIYHRLLQKTGLEASQCLFIDDRLENVEAARALGFASEVFVSASQLRLDLLRHQLLRH